MLTEYLKAAMARAHYEILEDDDTFVGTIPGFKGVWANASQLEACREELAEVLEEWVLLRVSRHMTLPEVDGITLKIMEVEAA